MKPSSAGSKVSEASMVSATVTVAATAAPSRNDRPSANWPSSATTTVRPANSTARPAVLTAVTAASSVPARPAAAAVAGDDEQGVVDPDAEADQDPQDRAKLTMVRTWLSRPVRA